jgi:hypothetical protein
MREAGADEQKHGCVENQACSYFGVRFCGSADLTGGMKRYEHESQQVSEDVGF